MINLIYWYASKMIKTSEGKCFYLIERSYKHPAARLRSTKARVSPDMCRLVDSNEARLEYAKAPLRVHQVGSKRREQVNLCMTSI